MWQRFAAPCSVMSRKTLNCTLLRFGQLLIYSIFPLSTLLLSVLGLSRQLGGAGDTKMVSKACLIESERNCFHTAKCLWGKMNIIFISSFISVSVILILSFYVCLFVFHPQSLKRRVSGGECSALNFQIKQCINKLSHTEENKSLATILS